MEGSYEVSVSPRRMIFAEVIGMKYGILAAAFLLTSASFASADYVIIVANVGVGKELKTVGGAGMTGMPGMMGGMMGMRGGSPPNMGMMGMMGGSPPNMGVAGMQGGSPPNMGMRGMGPMGPGAGMAGGQMQGSPNAMGVQGGSRPGMMMGMGGMPGGMAGQRGGMMGMGGMPGGMMGQRGGMMMGMGGGMMMGMGGMMGMMGVGATDADDAPDYVIAVVEVKPLMQGSLVKRLDQKGFAAVELPNKRLGKSCQLLKNPSFGEMFVITEGKDKAIPTVKSRFQEMFDKTMKEKPSVTDLRTLADWALEHGLVDRFPAVMDKLVETDKTNPAAVAYLKVKADLDRKAGDDPSVASWRRELLRGYKVMETPHYLLVHNVAKDTAVEITTHAEHLENAFRGFYYWFALKGIALTVPQNRQIVVLTAKEDDFEQLRKVLTPGPVVVDGFFARRENLAVMHSQRQDDPYRALTTFWENWKGKGFQLQDLLNGGSKWSGAPRSVQLQGQQGLVKTMEAQMIALMLKALEQEAELATVSHEASRQLLFASGLLPHNVAVPEWILFGMGSLFETPLQSPWPTTGAPSPYYLPRWRELKAKDSTRGGLEKTSLDTLRKVVTDGYFRTLPREGRGDSEHHLHEAALRKGRTVAWSLTYFLAQQKLDGLRHYFAELSKMPRDIELDDTVLLGCFARAFGCVDANNKINDSELRKLANEWYGYWQNVHFEWETTMRDIRKKIADKMKESQDKAQKENEPNAAQPGPGLFPGMIPGGAPAGGATQPGGPVPPANPQRGGRPNPSAPIPPRQR